jgi:hypothetical protein
MKIIIVLSILFFVLISTGCARQTVYDSLRYHQEMDCQKMYGADQTECYKRSGMSYDDYQKRLKERPSDKE